MTGNANRQGSNKNSLLSEMLRMRLRFALRLLAVLPPLGLGACADTMTAGQPLASSTELLRDYDKTLTKSEQKAAIRRRRQTRPPRRRHSPLQSKTSGWSLDAGAACPAARFYGSSGILFRVLIGVWGPART